jgi:hypothetical protein
MITLFTLFVFVVLVQIIISLIRRVSTLESDLAAWRDYAELLESAYYRVSENKESLQDRIIALQREKHNIPRVVDKSATVQTQIQRGLDLFVVPTGYRVVQDEEGKEFFEKIPPKKAQTKNDKGKQAQPAQKKSSLTAHRETVNQALQNIIDKVESMGKSPITEKESETLKSWITDKLGKGQKLSIAGMTRGILNRRKKQTA